MLVYITMAIILARKTKNSGGDKSTLPPDFSLEEVLSLIVRGRG
jgi:hypothetical protein